jgi:hypothetical protein
MFDYNLQSDSNLKSFIGGAIYEIIKERPHIISYILFIKKFNALRFS